MDNVASIQTFLGWTVVLHFALMLFAFGCIMLAGDFVRSKHRRLFGLSDEELSRAYFQYFAFYKLGIFLFALVPWLALELMT